MKAAADINRVHQALRDAGPRGLRIRDFREEPTIDGGPVIEHVPAVLWALDDDGVEILQDQGARFWLKDFAPKGREGLERAASSEPTGVAAGFRHVVTCPGCLAVRPLGSRCEHGFIQTATLIDPDLNDTWPCQRAQVLAERAATESRAA